jgi:4-azaleucine resistance transporter AzlC
MRIRQDFALGCKAGLPIAMGYVPIALAFGTLAEQSGLHLPLAVLMSAAVFAGASQFMAVSMLLAGAGWIQIVTATFFLNLRHLIMSMTTAETLKHLPRHWTSLLFLGLTDETFAVLTLNSRQHNADRASLAYVAGLILTAYAAWVAGTFFGSGFAWLIPASLGSGMSIALYAMFIGLLVPAVRDNRPTIIIALVSMAFSWLLHQVLDQGWAVVGATVCGATVGTMIMKRK